MTRRSLLSRTITAWTASILASRPFTWAASAAKRLLPARKKKPVYQFGDQLLADFNPAMRNVYDGLSIDGRPLVFVPYPGGPKITQFGISHGEFKRAQKNAQ